MFPSLRIIVVALIAIGLMGCPDENNSKGPNPDKKTCHQSCQEAYDACLNSGRSVESCTQDFNACDQRCE